MTIDNVLTWGHMKDAGIDTDLVEPDKTDEGIYIATGSIDGLAYVFGLAIDQADGEPSWMWGEQIRDLDTGQWVMDEFDGGPYTIEERDRMLAAVVAWQANR